MLRESILCRATSRRSALLYSPSRGKSIYETVETCFPPRTFECECRPPLYTALRHAVQFCKVTYVSFYLLMIGWEGVDWMHVSGGLL
jgi:hypothetical protein